VVPRLRRLAIIFNVGNAQPVLEMRETEAAARTLGIEVVPLEIRRVADFSPAFQALRGNTDALYVAIDQLMVANLMRILALALGVRLPTIFSTAILSEAGASCPMGGVRIGITAVLHTWWPATLV
jgi:putative ABC transport system substrate-binding protein